MENECITVTIDRITFYNEENGYYVLKTSSREYPSGVTVVGKLGFLSPGEEIRAYGTWACHPSFGMQFQAFKSIIIRPSTLKGIEKYLGSGLIKGIGPVLAKKLVDTFAYDTLDIIENEPEKLMKCPGIGANRLETIVKGWHLQRSIQDIMIFLQGHGISSAYAAKIYKKYGREAVQKVSKNPYILADEIPGMGFKKADAIAAEFGIVGDDLRRIEACVKYILSSSNLEGHLFLEHSAIIKKTQKMLELSDTPEKIEIATESLIKQKKIIVRDWKENKLCYSPNAYYSEEESIKLIKRLLILETPLNRATIMRAVSVAVEKQGVDLSNAQQLAIEMSLKKGFLVITGGPGTGKTTTLKAVINAHKSLGKTLAVASPTGRAAKRLAEVSGFPAKTIHRLLEYSPQERGFKRNYQNPLEADTVVIDEASMIDMLLFYHLIQSIKETSVLILVGDSNQLPSVGAGRVLNELIDSKLIPTVQLDTIFRQAQTSQIVKNAHLINSGNMPHLTVPDGKTVSDCFFVESQDHNKTLELLKNIVQKNLPQKFGYNPASDIQVITPMNRGSLGAHALNPLLQSILNPPSQDKVELQQIERTFREGDKIIQLCNNYDLDVYNGDIGFIKKISLEDQEAVIEFPQGDVVFQTSDFVDIAHAYAITVHKSQGSEYPAIVFVLSMQHYVMLQRNLLYTGLTRAKKTAVILGSTKAVRMSVNNNQIRLRNTILAELLSE